MFLRLLIPISLLLPTLALVVDSSSLRHYRGSAWRETTALLLCIAIYFVAWFALYSLIGTITGSDPAALVAASLLSLLTLQPALFLAFKLLGVRRGGSGSPASAH